MYDTVEAKVVVYESEIDLVGRHVADFPDLETGGDLFGFWTHSGYPVVQCAVGPGPLARRTATSFYQDEAYLREVGGVLSARHGLQHIGQWHSHHRMGLDHPSGGDVNTVRRALEESGIARFFVVIATLRACRDGREVPSLRGYLFQRGMPVRTPWATAGWVVLPGRSPVRLDDRSRRVFDMSVPRSPSVPVSAEPRMGLDEPVAGPVPVPADSWARTEAGVKLLGAVQRELSAIGDTRLTVDDEGRVEARWKADCTSWRLAFDHDTSIGAARASLHWTAEPEAGSLPVEGTMADVLGAVHRHVDEVESTVLQRTLGIDEETVFECVPEPASVRRPGRLVRAEEQEQEAARCGSLEPARSQRSLGERVRDRAARALERVRSGLLPASEPMTASEGGREDLAKAKGVKP